MDNNKLLSAKNDVIFRLFFADERNQEFLISFLKSVLRLPEEDYDQIEIADPHLLREYPKDKLGIIDVKLHTKSRKAVHIEIQLSVTPDMLKRIVFYDAKLITEQLGSGDVYDTIKKVISIVITNEKLIQRSLGYHHRFTMYDAEAGVELTDLVEVNTLELPKLPDGTDGTVLYDWARFIAAESEEELDMIAQRNPEVGKAAVKLVELSADERARYMYELREKERRDLESQKRWAVKQREFEFAKNMVADGEPVDKIMRYTGLAYEDIESLRVVD